jgi:hypothetical protein
LESGDQKPRGSLLAFALGVKPLLSKFAVFVEKFREMLA